MDRDRLLRVGLIVSVVAIAASPLILRSAQPSASATAAVQMNDTVSDGIAADAVLLPTEPDVPTVGWTSTPPRAATQRTPGGETITSDIGGRVYRCRDGVILGGYTGAFVDSCNVYEYFEGQLVGIRRR